jgi:hypothetical protein
MITIYKYVRPGERFGRIPARDLTEAEYEQALEGRTPEQKALIGTLYKKARVAAPAPANTESTTTRGVAAQPAEQAEEATNASTDRS